MDTNNLETIEIQSEGSGNTDEPTLQPPQLKHHFFTFNNYNRDDIYMFCKLFDEICYMYCFQEEIGEKNNTPHLQGIISLHKRMRRTEFGLPKQIHWESVKHITKAYAYCSDIKKRRGDIFYKNYKVQKHLIINNRKEWMDTLENIIKVKCDDTRKIHWYYDTRGGAGKSIFSKYLCLYYNAIYLSRGNYKDLINLVYKSEDINIVIVDLPRNNGNRVSYDALEAIKNGIICNVKYETGTKVFDSPHIIVFSNERPDMSCLSKDRWNIKNITVDACA